MDQGLPAAERRDTERPLVAGMGVGVGMGNFYIAAVVIGNR